MLRFYHDLAYRILTVLTENRPTRDCAREEARPLDHAHALVYVLAQLSGLVRQTAFICVASHSLTTARPQRHCPRASR